MESERRVNLPGRWVVLLAAPEETPLSRECEKEKGERDELIY
jgi:hypothetical protein